METAEMRDIKLFGTSTDEMLWKRTSLSFVDGNTTHLPLFWVCPQADTLMSWPDQQANSVYHSLDARFIRETTRNTPPR